MIKKLILLAAGAVMMMACEKVVPVPDAGGKEEQEKEEERETVENLSAGGTANCYVIGRGGCYSFDATVRGNGVTVEGVVTAFGGDAGSDGRLTNGTTNATAITAHQARLIWQSCAMVSDVALVEGAVQFKIADGAYGNALIGVEDENGTILWSWHIWYPEQMPVAIGKQGFMNLNLGAIRSDVGTLGSVGGDGINGGEGRAGVIGGMGRAGSRENLPLTYGMMYQWGRKDPLPGSPVVTGDTSTQPCEVYGPDGEVVKIGWFIPLMHRVLNTASRIPIPAYRIWVTRVNRWTGSRRTRRTMVFGARVM